MEAAGRNSGRKLKMKKPPILVWEMRDNKVDSKTFSLYPKKEGRFFVVLIWGMGAGNSPRFRGLGKGAAELKIERRK